MAKKKNKTRSTSQFTHKSIVAAERGHYGDEPDFTDSVDAGCIRMKATDKDGKPDPVLAYLKSLNWYNAMGNPSKYGGWLVDYAKDKLSLDKDKLKQLRKINSAKVPSDIAVNARILLRGGDSFVPSVKAELVDKFVARVIDAYATQEKTSSDNKSPDTTDTSKTKKPSVQEYMQSAADAVYAEKVIPLIDRAFSLDKKVYKEDDLYTILTKADIKGRVALKVAELIKPTLDELQDAIDKKSEDLVEAYSFITTAQKKKIAEFLQAMLDDCDRVNNVSKKTRKVSKRTKKPKTADKILSKFKFKSKDDEFKIASADPKTILGASCVVLFNTKNRKATLLVAEGRDGLSIKGASIVGFDAKQCDEKTIRKPSEFFAAVRGKGLRAIKKTFDGIKAKNSFKNGKANVHTIVLRIAK